MPYLLDLDVLSKKGKQRAISGHHVKCLPRTKWFTKLEIQLGVKLKFRNLFIITSFSVVIIDFVARGDAADERAADEGHAHRRPAPQRPARRRPADQGPFYPLFLLYLLNLF